MVNHIGILLEDSGTKRYGLLHIQFNVILINVSMQHYIDAAGLRVKVDDDIFVTEIYHEENI